MRLALLVLLLGCGATVIPTSAGSWLDSLGDDARACTVDDECVAIELDCCGCSNDSGVTGAVHRDHLQAATEHRQTMCSEEQMCLDALSGHVSCWGGRPACVRGQCEMVER